jgi:hypothetical protein
LQHEVNFKALPKMKKDRYANDIIPGEAFHPCETVREELEAQGKQSAYSFGLLSGSGLNLQPLLAFPDAFFIRNHNKYHFS